MRTSQYNLVITKKQEIVFTKKYLYTKFSTAGYEGPARIKTALPTPFFYKLQFISHPHSSRIPINLHATSVVLLLYNSKEMLPLSLRKFGSTAPANATASVKPHTSDSRNKESPAQTANGGPSAAESVYNQIRKSAGM